MPEIDDFRSQAAAEARAAKINIARQDLDRSIERLRQTEKVLSDARYGTERAMQAVYAAQHALRNAEHADLAARELTRMDHENE